MSDVIRAAVRKSGRTLYALGAETGISRGNLTRFMSGARGLTLDSADKLAVALGLELRPAKRRSTKGG